MKFSKTLTNFLSKNKIKYELLKHRTVYTALDKAATLKVRPTTVGKTVIVSLDDKDHAIGLIPANKNLDKQKVLAAFNKLIKKTTIKPSNILENIGRFHSLKNKKRNYKKINFTTEKWMKTNIKGVKIGAAPPFGELYKLSFFIDNALVKQSKIIINAGEYELSLKLSPAALIKLNQNILRGNFTIAKK